MLKVINFTKKYGKKVAVNNLSLHVKKGEIYGFVGHNGAGKTTTLKACCGINSVEEGEIFVCGQSIKTNAYECKKKIAYLPDNPDIYNFMSGIQYLEFIADVFEMSANERKSQIEKYAGIFDIQKSLGSSISSYSHGMRQKLVIISAWMHNPQLILMDEPFVGLDPIAISKLKGLMREHCDNGGAILFSTHILDVVEKLCDKIAILKGGNLMANGSLDEIVGDRSLEEVFFELEA